MWMGINGAGQLANVGIAEPAASLGQPAPAALSHQARAHHDRLNSNTERPRMQRVQSLGPCVEASVPQPAAACMIVPAV
jgi:hypothetical protein